MQTDETSCAVCAVCGHAHTKLGLALALGIDTTKHAHLNATIGGFDKVLRHVKAEAIEEVFARVHRGATVREAVNAPIVAVTASPTPAAGSIDAAVQALIAATKSQGISEERVLEIVEDAIANRAPDSIDDARVISIVREQLEALAPKRLEVKTEHTRVTIDEHTHVMFPALLELINAGEPAIALVGPRGASKTTMAIQAAKALGFRWCVVAMTEETRASVFIGKAHHVTGDHISTPFLECYEAGRAVIILDEFDRANANTACVLHAAMDQGILTVPDRPQKPVATRGESVIFVAPMNTYGHGADRSYVAANQLDSATLDRFGGETAMLFVDYDEALEEKLCPDPAIREWVKRTREKITAAKLRRGVSLRFLIAADRQTRAGIPFETVKARYFGGWKTDERARVEA